MFHLVLAALLPLAIAGSAGIAAAGCGGSMSGSGGCGSGGHGSHSEMSAHAAGHVVVHHGGRLNVTDANAFETVFGPDGIRVYRYDLDGGPRFVQDASGTAEIRDAGGRKHKLELEPRKPAEGEPAVWYCTMDPDIIRSEAGTCPRCGMSLVVQDYLFAPIEAASLGAAGGQEEPPVVEIRIKGLGDPEKKVKFTQPWLEGTGTGAAENHSRPAMEEDHAQHANH